MKNKLNTFLRMFHYLWILVKMLSLLFHWSILWKFFMLTFLIFSEIGTFFIVQFVNAAKKIEKTQVLWFITNYLHSDPEFFVWHICKPVLIHCRKVHIICRFYYIFIIFSFFFCIFVPQTFLEGGVELIVSITVSKNSSHSSNNKLQKKLRIFHMIVRYFIHTIRGTFFLDGEKIDIKIMRKH